MQRYELDAWLGDNNSDLTDEQATDLLRVANQIEQRYPDPDDSEEAQSALTVAYRLMVEDPGEVIDEVADDLVRARLAEQRALAALRQAALILVRNGGRSIESQQGFAKRAGVDRMVVRDWLGLR